MFVCKYSQNVYYKNSKFLDVCDLLIESGPNLSNVASLKIEKDLLRLNAPTWDIKSAQCREKNHVTHGTIFISCDLTQDITIYI